MSDPNEKSQWVEATATILGIALLMLLACGGAGWYVVRQARTAAMMEALAVREAEMRRAEAEKLREEKERLEHEMRERESEAKKEGE
jgi:uncharacterized protein HemX